MCYSLHQGIFNLEANVLLIEIDYLYTLDKLVNILDIRKQLVESMWLSRWQST